MRVLLNGASDQDVLRLRVNEINSLLRGVDRKIDELVAGMTDLKRDQ
jgi:hypothetical protein